MEQNEVEKKKKVHYNYYIKERNNPQFLMPYYMKLGRISKKEAKSHENSVYGSNILMSYKTEQEYLSAIDEFKSKGFDVR